MFSAIKPNLIRRFSRIRSKTNFPENNKVTEELVKKQDKKLNDIVDWCCLTFCMSVLGTLIACNR
jgi:hypothetical protein